jgi:hypothetical protein
VVVLVIAVGVGAFFGGMAAGGEGDQSGLAQGEFPVGNSATVRCRGNARPETRKGQRDKNCGRGSDFREYRSRR